jgi:signal transduction histidine kinase/CheY-like chemotaxis protein
MKRKSIRIRRVPVVETTDAVGDAGQEPRDYEAHLGKCCELCRAYWLSVNPRPVLVEDDQMRLTLFVVLALAALRSSSTGLALVRDGKVLTRNQAWRDLEGSSSSRWQRVKGKSLQGNPVNGLDRVALRQVRALERDSKSVEEDLFAQPQTGRFVEARVERIPSPARLQSPTFMVMIHDVTARVRAEKDLEQARQVMVEQERMRAIGQLASGVAHDLNNALHAMSLRLARLCSSGTLELDQRANLDALIRTVGDTAARVGRLQELARHRQDVPTEAVDFAPLIEEVVAVARSEVEDRSQLATHRLVIETDVPKLPRVVGVSAELRHLFLNLLVNARDAMPQGGRIRVEARHLGSQVVVAVKDDGVGIAPEHLARVFEPFFTTKGQRGAGLGLSIAYGVMQRLGGSITAGNRPEGGAVITLSFPVAAGPLEMAPARAEPRVPPSGKRILVIDDDPDNLDATRWVLEEMGQDVECAASGPQALKRFEEGARFDLVLSDIGMPEMNGWEVAERIQKIAPGTRAVMISGWAHEIARDDPRRRLVLDVLPKPLALDEVQRLLSDVLEPSPRTPAARPGSRFATPAGAFPLRV